MGKQRMGRAPVEDRDALTVREAADYLGVSVAGLLAWGALPCYRVGPRRDRRYLISTLDLIRQAGRPSPFVCPTCQRPWDEQLP